MRCSHVNCYSLRKKQERTTTTTKNMLEINKHKGFINGIIVIIKCKTSKPKKIVVCICGQYKKEHGFTDAPFFNCKMSLIFVISDQINYRHGTKSTLFLLHPNWDGCFFFALLLSTPMRFLHQCWWTKPHFVEAKSTTIEICFFFLVFES